MPLGLQEAPAGSLFCRPCECHFVRSCWGRAEKTCRYRSWSAWAIPGGAVAGGTEKSNDLLCYSERHGMVFQLLFLLAFSYKNVWRKGTTGFFHLHLLLNKIEAKWVPKQTIHKLANVNKTTWRPCLRKFPSHKSMYITPKKCEIKWGNSVYCTTVVSKIFKTNKQKTNNLIPCQRPPPNS